MTRGHLRRVAIALVGLVYFGLTWILAGDLWHSRWFVEMHRNACEPMFLSFMVSLGLFLLLAVPKPHEHRSLIVFAAWNSLFHAFVMVVETVEAWSHGVRRDYTDVVVATVFGLLLLVAIPPSRKSSSASGECTSSE